MTKEAASARAGRGVFSSARSREEFKADGLLRRMAAGDHEALKDLYELWAPTLLGVAHRLLRDRTLAEEAVQDVFVRMWRRAGDYDPAAGRPFVWAYSILRGICLDLMRKNSRLKRGRNVRFEAPSGVEADHGAESELICREISEQVMRGLAAMPEDERRCLELYVFQEFTQREIAEETRSPLGTIKTRVRRALRNLREIIDRHA